MPHAHSGVFLVAADCNREGQHATITHPRGYDGNGGELHITIGIDPESVYADEMRQAVQNIVDTFNALTPTTGNIQRLSVADPDTTFDFESVALHEIGHALGLGHPSLGGCLGTRATDRYTNAKKNGPAYTLDPGSDGIRGSQDDGRGNDVNIHWFFRRTNNPFVLEDVVDESTYTRLLADLPAGHTFAANGNKGLAEHMGFLDTEAAMYWILSPGQVRRTLIPDDIATLMYAMSGIDETADTSDDYTVELSLGDAASADIVLSFSRARFANYKGNAALTDALGFTRIGPDRPYRHYVVAQQVQISFNGTGEYRWFFTR